MDYRDTYANFEWKRLEGEMISEEESPLDALVRQENMRQLSDALLKLNRVELVCTMMMHYDEVESGVAEVQEYMKKYYGKEHSRYMIRKFERNALRKIRTRLKNVFGWQDKFGGYI